MFTEGSRGDWIINGMKNKAAYLSYLLRVWQVEENGRFSWHGSLEKTGGRREMYFIDPDDLFAFLRVQMQKIEDSQNDALPCRAGECDDRRTDGKEELGKVVSISE